MKLFTNTLLLALTVLFVACNDKNDDPQPTPKPQTVVQVATDDPNDSFSTLVAALTEANLVSTLEGDGPFTVFAPTNDAFAKLLDETGLTADELLASEDLSGILTYHVVAGKVLSTQLSNGEVETLSGDKIMINIDNGVTINGTVNVTQADIETDNGVVHVIDGVLVPSELKLNPSIVDIAVGDENFSILVEALAKAGLVDALSADGPFTVFAPTNDAFAALLEELGVTKEELLDREDLADILLYHVVSAKVLSTDLANGEVGTLLDNANVTVDLSGGVMINSSNVTTADIEGSNGVIHVIDEVLLPPNIYNIALRNGSFNTLVAAVNKAGLATTLSGGDYTVFAPTDDAFAALLADLGITAEDLLNDTELAQILLYHVVSGTVTSGQLTAGFVETAAEIDVEVGLTGGVTLNGDVNVTTADVTALNGVIHIVDKVIVPPTIADLVARSADFSTLKAALETADLVTTLDGSDDFTVFAPTNTSFESLLADLGITASDLLADPSLASYLTYHVVSGKVFSDGLPSSAATVEGNNVYFSIGTDVFINGTVKINAVDIKMKNGVIHVIDYVLLPPTMNIVETAIDKGYNELAAALTRVQNETSTKVIDILSGSEGTPFTVFAPNDAAFDALYVALGVNNVDEIDIATLTNVLLYHVVGETAAFSTDLVEGQEIPTLLTDNNLTVNLADLLINDAELNPDAINTIATNGVIHEINSVIIPQ